MIETDKYSAFCQAKRLIKLYHIIPKKKKASGSLGSLGRPGHMHIELISALPAVYTFAITAPGMTGFLLFPFCFY